MEAVVPSQQVECLISWLMAHILNTEGKTTELDQPQVEVLDKVLRIKYTRLTALVANVFAIFFSHP